MLKSYHHHPLLVAAPYAALCSYTFLYIVPLLTTHMFCPKLFYYECFMRQAQQLQCGELPFRRSRNLLVMKLAASAIALAIVVYQCVAPHSLMQFSHRMDLHCVVLRLLIRLLLQGVLRVFTLCLNCISWKLLHVQKCCGREFSSLTHSCSKAITRVDELV